MNFNENTRVKIPALIHLTRLGYEYLILSHSKWDLNTNIFTDIFKESIKRINPQMNDAGVKRLYEDINIALDGEDLGEKFYKLPVLCFDVLGTACAPCLAISSSNSRSSANGNSRI